MAPTRNTDTGSAPRSDADKKAYQKRLSAVQQTAIADRDPWCILQVHRHAKAIYHTPGSIHKDWDPKQRIIVPSLSDKLPYLKAPQHLRAIVPGHQLPMDFGEVDHMFKSIRWSLRVMAATARPLHRAELEMYCQLMLATFTRRPVNGPCPWCEDK